MATRLLRTGPPCDARRPLSRGPATPTSTGSGGSWCPRQGAPSPTTIKSLTTVRPLSSQEALPNSCVDSCLQRVGPGAICCPHPHPCLPAGLPDVSISRVGSSGEVCLRGVGKGLHEAQVPILQARAWAPVDSRASDPARQRSAEEQSSLPREDVQGARRTAQTQPTVPSLKPPADVCVSSLSQFSSHFS